MTKITSAELDRSSHALHVSNRLMVATTMLEWTEVRLDAGILWTARDGTIEIEEQTEYGETIYRLDSRIGNIWNNNEQSPFQSLERAKRVAEKEAKLLDREQLGWDEWKVLEANIENLCERFPYLTHLEFDQLEELLEAGLKA
jgi:hypothetical protein